MSGNLRMFVSIIIFGGSFSATLIRFPLTSIFHGLPLGAKFAFSMRRTAQRSWSTRSRRWPRSRASRARPAWKRSRSRTKGIRFVADNMTDPSKLGPFMATALLATLYGAVVANLRCPKGGIGLRLPYARDSRPAV